MMPSPSNAFRKGLRENGTLLALATPYCRASTIRTSVITASLIDSLLLVKPVQS
jgi:hypothetical protein